MKKIHFLILIGFLSTIQFANAQAQEKILPPSEGKAVVYFIRTSSLGSLINFKYFDNNYYIGKFNGRNFIRYECEPGKHIFWAKSENIDFIDAEVKAGSIYLIEVKPKFGAIKAAVGLKTVDGTDKRQMKRIYKILKKRDALVLDANKMAEEAEKLKGKIKKGLEKIEKKKEKGRKLKKITPEMEYIKQ